MYWPNLTSRSGQSQFDIWKLPVFILKYIEENQIVSSGNTAEENSYEWKPLDFIGMQT